MTNFGRIMDSKMAKFVKLIENFADIQHLISNPKSLTVEEVSLIAICHVVTRPKN